MTQCKTILFLTDEPGGTVAQDLDILYPGRVEKLDFSIQPHKADILARHSHVITMVRCGRNLNKLNYEVVTEYARGGGQVISCLLEFARNRGLEFSKTHVGDRVRPAIRIEVESDITRGFAAGDSLWWFGAVSSAPDNLYSNQMVQRQVLGARESENLAVLATSNLNGGAALIEERVGNGRILAMDLLSPLRPFHNSYGSAAKYLFLGNFIGRSVRYGKHYPRKLSYDGFVEAMRALPHRFPKLRLKPEGACSDGRQMWSFGLGDERYPTMYFGAVLHGWEWEAAYGLLRLTELLCADPRIEGLATDRLHFKIVPIQNPYGYDHFVRQNARGVDLNRNFDVAWGDYPDISDVPTPWDFGYQGTRPASEPETGIIQRIIDRHVPRCVIDLHTADYRMDYPHRGETGLMDAIHANIKSRLKDRYVTQRPYGGPYQQVNMDNRHLLSRSLPYLVCHAAERGVPAALLIELSGNRDDVHALVMNTDTVVEICLAAVEECLKWKW